MRASDVHNLFKFHQRRQIIKIILSCFSSYFEHGCFFCQLECKVLCAAIIMVSSQLGRATFETIDTLATV